MQTGLHGRCCIRASSRLDIAVVELQKKEDPNPIEGYIGVWNDAKTHRTTALQQVMQCHSKTFVRFNLKA